MRSLALIYRAQDLEHSVGHGDAQRYEVVHAGRASGEAPSRVRLALPAGRSCHVR